MAKLIVERDGRIEKEVRLEGQELRIGRGDKNDLVLVDAAKSLSRVHAEVRREGDCWMLLDLDSHNGTWIGNQKITKVSLKDGMVAAVGSFQLRFVEENPDQSLSPGSTASMRERSSETLVSGSGGASHGREALPPPAHPARQSETRTAAGLWPRENVGRHPLADNIVSKLKRVPKPMLVGGFASVMVLTIIVGRLVQSDESPSVVASLGTTVDITTPAPPPPPPPDLIAARLSETRMLMETGQLDDALSRLGPVLLMAPEDSGAKELETQLKEMIAARTANNLSELPTAPRPPDRDRDVPVEPGWPPQRPGENRNDYGARAKRVKEQYEAGKESLGRGDHQVAVDHFRTVLNDQPGHLDTETLLHRAQAAMVSARVQELLQAAASSERAQDLPKAIAQYREAQALENTASTATSIQRVLDQMKKEGEEAYKAAVQLDAFDDSRLQAQALANYERAINYLPSDHPDRAKAVAKLNELKTRP